MMKNSLTSEQAQLIIDVLLEEDDDDVNEGDDAAVLLNSEEVGTFLSATILKVWLK